MKEIFALTDKVVIGEYTIEYSNFNILIKKRDTLVKCIDVNSDFNGVEYTKLIRRYKNSYNKK